MAGPIRVAVRVNDRKLAESISRTIRALPAARDASLGVSVKLFVESLNALWARDTHRSLRGWQIAARQAGMYNGPIDAVRPSRRAQRIEEILIAQVAYWTERVRRAAILRQSMASRLRAWGYIDATTKRKDTPWSRLAKAKIRNLDRDLDPARERSAAGRLARARRSLEEWAKSNKTAVVFGAGAGNIYNNAEATVPFTKSGKPTVARAVAELYGGRGEVIVGDGFTIVRLVNLEPHTRIVERRSRVVRATLSALRARGLRQIGEAGTSVLVLKSATASLARRS